MRRELYFAEDTIKQTTNVNSTFNAGGDLAVRGAQVTADGDANLQALGNVLDRIISVQNLQNGTSLETVTKANAS